MAIKKLQNNYTTTEQSKRLLELGVPADSADCYHNRIVEKPYILSMPYSYCNWDDKDNPPLPCWSVGRLIEIFELCTSSKFERIKTKCSVLEDILWQIEIYVTETSVGFSIDFSKLEE